MKDKKLVFILCSFLVCLLLVTITGCRKEDQNVDEGSVLVIGTSAEENDLSEGQFNPSEQDENKTSNAKKLGHSATLDIEYSENETMPDEDENANKEPQWLPGIW